MTRVADWQITNPTVDDAADLSAMAQQSFCETFFAMNYPPDDLAQFLAEAMSASRYEKQISDPNFALRIVRRSHGDERGRIVAFIKLGPNELPMPPGEPPPSATWELHQLYVREEAKGSGIADMLMHWAIDEARARGAIALYLSVFVENHRAQRFYARHGFAEIGKNPFRIGNVIDDDRVWRLML
ncbi:MAG: GNAT family N-acetyltransferase [Sphingopyxis sp.]